MLCQSTRELTGRPRFLPHSWYGIHPSIHLSVRHRSPQHPPWAKRKSFPLGFHDIGKKTARRSAPHTAMDEAARHGMGTHGNARCLNGWMESRYTRTPKNTQAHGCNMVCVRYTNHWFVVCMSVRLFRSIARKILYDIRFACLPDAAILYYLLALSTCSYIISRATSQ